MLAACTIDADCERVFRALLHDLFCHGQPLGRAGQFATTDVNYPEECAKHSMYAPHQNSIYK